MKYKLIIHMPVKRDIPILEFMVKCLENSVKRWLKEFGKKVKEFSKGVRGKGNNQKETDENFFFLILLISLHI